MIGRVMVLLSYRHPDLGQQLDEVLSVLADTPGFDNGWVGRSPDDPDQWILAARWTDVGAMRHALGSYDAKMALGPLQAAGTGQDLVVEVLTEHDGAGTRTHDSDLAADAAHTGPTTSGERA